MSRLIAIFVFCALRAFPAAGRQAPGFDFDRTLRLDYVHRVS